MHLYRFDAIMISPKTTEPLMAGKSGMYNHDPASILSALTSSGKDSFILNHSALIIIFNNLDVNT